VSIYNKVCYWFTGYEFYFSSVKYSAYMLGLLTYLVTYLRLGPFFREILSSRSTRLANECIHGVQKLKTENI